MDRDTEEREMETKKTERWVSFWEPRGVCPPAVPLFAEFAWRTGGEAPFMTATAVAIEVGVETRYLVPPGEPEPKSVAEADARRLQVRVLDGRRVLLVNPWGNGVALFEDLEMLVCPDATQWFCVTPWEDFAAARARTQAILTNELKGA